MDVCTQVVEQHMLTDNITIFAGIGDIIYHLPKKKKDSWVTVNSAEPSFFVCIILPPVAKVDTPEGAAEWIEALNHHAQTI